jgi:hypothetical protein
MSIQSVDRVKFWSKLNWSKIHKCYIHLCPNYLQQRKMEDISNNCMGKLSKYFMYVSLTISKVMEKRWPIYGNFSWLMFTAPGVSHQITSQDFQNVLFSISVQWGLLCRLWSTKTILPYRPRLSHRNVSCLTLFLLSRLKLYEVCSVKCAIK